MLVTRHLLYDQFNVQLSDHCAPAPVHGVIVPGRQQEGSSAPQLLPQLRRQAGGEVRSSGERDGLYLSYIVAIFSLGFNWLPLSDPGEKVGASWQEEGGKRQEAGSPSSWAVVSLLDWAVVSSGFPSGFALRKSLGAALPALGKPRPSLLFYLD